MTGLAQRIGQIHRGFGVVIRWPGVAAVIPSDENHDATVDAMIDGLGPDPQAPDLVAAVDRLLAEGDLQAIGLVVDAEDGPLAMAFGSVEILADGAALVSGEDGLTRHRLPADADRLTIRSVEFDNAAEPVPPYDLRRGVAPGAGLTLARIVGTTSADEADSAPSVPAPPRKPEGGPDPGGGPIITDEGIPASAPVPPQPPSASPVLATAAPLAAAPAGPLAGADLAGGSVGAGVDTGDAHPDDLFDPADNPADEPAGSILDPADTAFGRAAADSPGDEPPAAPQAEEPPTFFADDGDDPTNGSVGDEAEDGLNGHPEVPFRSVVLTDDAPLDPTEPLPTAQAETTGQVGRLRADEGRVEVEGILCPRGHFNNPSALVCMVCGLSTAHLRDERVFGPRPTLGFVVFDDGTTYGLDRSYVIGREPRLPEDSDASSLVVRTDNETLSRTHAEIQLDGWAVNLVDLGSTNGTYVWDVAEERWNRLDPGSVVELVSGDTIAVGRRTFVFEGVGG
jgi:hypothetical protein